MDIILQDEKENHSYLEGGDVLEISTSLIEEKINEIHLNGRIYKGIQNKNEFLGYIFI